MGGGGGGIVNSGASLKPDTELTWETDGKRRATWACAGGRPADNAQTPGLHIHTTSLDGADNGPNLPDHSIMSGAFLASTLISSEIC